MSDSGDLRPALRAWLSNGALNITDNADATHRLTTSDLEGGGLKMVKLADDVFAVVIVTADGRRVEGIADHSSARSVAKALGSHVPSEELVTSVGAAPEFDWLVAGKGVEAAEAVAQIRSRDRDRGQQALPVTTGFDIPGYRIVSILGIVTGSTVRTRHIGSKLVAGVTQNFGGELPGFTKLLDEARAEAVERMVARARSGGADAVIGFSFSTADVFEGAAEVLACGTSVRTEPEP